MSETLANAVLIGGAPTIAISVAGFLLKRLIADLGDAIKALQGKMDALQASVGAHQTDLGKLSVRVEVLEHEVERLRAKAA